MNHRRNFFSKHIFSKHIFSNQIGASLIAFSIAAFACTTQAQNMDVDQADTIDFQSFHKDKKEAVKIWDKKSSTTTKAYDDKAAEGSTATPAQSTTTTVPTAAQTTTPIAASTSAAKPNTTPAAALIPAGEAGKRFEIRERYTLTRSNKTPYSAFYVIEPLYKQAAQICPRGWKKLTERSEPIEQDFYLYYELECL